MRIITNPRTNPTRRQAQQGPTMAKGSGLSARKVNDYLRFSAFLVLIGMAYIWNSYRAEVMIKEREDLRTEVKSLKSRYLLRQANLGAATRLMTLRDELDSIGLRRLERPAYRLVRNQGQPISRLDTPRRDLEARRIALQREQDSLRALLDSLAADTCIDEPIDVETDNP
mgnify:CR=1 FL=1